MNLSELFQTFESTAYRVEALSTYAVPNESENFNRFLNGEELDPKDNADWISSVRDWVSSGKRVGRVRVISKELSLYEKYEFRCYHKNVNAGESVSVLPRELYDKLVPEIRRHDYWIFDDKIVARMKYDDEGHFLGVDVDETPEIVKCYADIYRELSQAAIYDYRYVVRQMNTSNVIIAFE